MEQKFAEIGVCMLSVYNGKSGSRIFVLHLAR
jgi:hypothetical protein